MSAELACRAAYIKEEKRPLEEVRAMGDEIEDRMLPALLLTSITVDVVAMCSQGWILGYYGDILVMQFSPWRLCRLDCFYCTKEKPTFRCFGMRGWTDTDFGKTTVPRLCFST